LNLRTLNDAFFTLFEAMFGSWDCGETFKNKDANWSFLAVSKRFFGTPQKLLKLRTLTDAY